MRSALLIGLGAWTFTWGAVLLGGTPARAHLPGGVFAATVTGAVEARPRGEAAFGVVAQDGAPGTFSITLDAPGSDGAVVLTGRSTERPRPGRVYRISEGGLFQALYIAGSAERPSGVFRGIRGTVEVLSASPTTIEARFRIEARGFLAAAPADESREVTVAGWFTAESRPLAVSSAAAGESRLP
jgi:hypothetical protein